jgi:hypothetical protein
MVSKLDRAPKTDMKKAPTHTSSQQNEKDDATAPDIYCLCIVLPRNNLAESMNTSATKPGRPFR